MAGGGSSGKGLADSELPLRTDMRASKRSRTFFCWSTMCVSDPIFLPSGWLRKRFREIEHADDSADINRLRACAGDCPSADDSGAGDQGTGVCGIGDRGTGSGNRGAGDSVSGRGSLDEFSACDGGISGSGVSVD